MGARCVHGGWTSVPAARRSESTLEAERYCLSHGASIVNEITKASGAIQKRVALIDYPIEEIFIKMITNECGKGIEEGCATDVAGAPQASPSAASS